MTKEQINAVAQYFTHGPRVAHHSIALQVGGKMGDEAKAFFAVRDALNIKGYATADEVADAVIDHVLAEGAPLAQP
jgi:uncharacterized membrane protein affecting hemolysin expression